MTDFLWQPFALLVLLGSVGLGYRLVRRVYPHPWSRSQQWIISVTVLTLAGGFWGAPIWWLDLAGGFAWDLPPLASRLLAAAGWAFALACGLALRRPTAQHLRLIMLMLLIYLLPLAVAIVLFHGDRFDWQATITYGFFAIVGLLVAGSLWFWLRPVGIVAAQPSDAVRPQRWVQAWLGLVAVVMGLWGGALFLTAQGPSSLIWVWPQDPLSSRLIAVMLLTLAGAALASLRSALLARTTLTALLVYAMGGVAGKAVPVGYVVNFAVVALGTALCLGWGVAAVQRPQAGIPARYQLHKSAAG